MIDAAQLDGYAELLTPDQVAGLIEAFDRELKSRPAQIRDLARQGDLASARSAAHRLKGACLTIGACSLAALADAIESAAGDDLPALAEALPACARDTCLAIAARP